MSAHQTDISSTLLVEKKNHNWVLQVSGALTAFEYVIEEQYGTNAYNSPRAFNALVLEYLKKHIEITFNKNATATLQKGLVKLGHETQVTFAVKGVPKQIEDINIKNNSFESIAHNQSILLVIKEGFTKNQFILDNNNMHTVNLSVQAKSFEQIETHQAAFGSYLYWLFLLPGLLGFFLLRNKNKSAPKISMLALVLLGGTGLMSSCNNTEDPIVETPQEEDYIIAESLFNSTSLVSFELVTSTLEDGTSAECFQITFTSNPVPSGPFCPDNINDVAGMGFYDGATNPGLRVFSAGLLNDIEADGYNMVNEDGSVNVEDFSGSGNPDASNCLEADANDNLQLTFTIPAVPKLASNINIITEIELIGLSLDGVPLNGDPPSAVNGPMMGGPGGGGDEIGFPSLDPCGGHHDPAGYYHWHFIPQVTNQVLTANGITEISCTLIDQTDDVELFGFAKDGFPIYAYAEAPTDLDDCGGRTAPTDEFPDGVYHYVASTTEAANVPKCIKGVTANNPFRFN